MRSHAADTVSPWRPEIELLLACARLHLTAEDGRRVDAAVRQGVDWERLLALGGAHGLLPLLHRHVSNGAVAMPSASLSRLRSLALAHTTRNLRLTAALVKLLRLCADHAIPAVPLKGPVLAQQVYGSIALRQAGDLDLLFRGADLPRLTRLLTERGYRLEARSSPQLDDLARRDLHHVAAIHPETNVRIELHYWLLRPRGRRRFGFDVVEPRLRIVPFLDVQVSVLEGEDLLVYLCEHGAEHTWSRLEWLASVAELLRGGHVRDWNRVEAWATELETTRRVRAAMGLIDRLIGAEQVVREPDRVASNANRIVRRRLRRDPGRVAESSGERFLYLLLTDPTRSACLRRIRTMLLKPGIGDGEALPLPRFLFPLYWVLRPVRLLVQRIRQRW